MRTVNNTDIRVKIALSGFTNYQIAEQVGVHPTTFSTWLSGDLSPMRLARIEKALETLQATNAKRGAKRKPCRGKRQ